jgi:plasmid replication initiation protein
MSLFLYASLIKFCYSLNIKKGRLNSLLHIYCVKKVPKSAFFASFLKFTIASAHLLDAIVIIIVKILIAMGLPSKDIKRFVAVSNQVAEYPPLDLTKLQYQALLVLISCIDSTEKPIYSIEDIVEEIKSKGITDQYEQMQYLEDLINRQNTYRIPYREYLRFFTGGETPQGGTIQRALDAVLSLNNKPFKFSNPEYEGSYVWFQAVALDKKTNDIVFIISSFAKPFLMGLRRDFLQMLAESTINFDGKYSVPIFLYMKSKLFQGREEYHGSESLDIFKRRFGLGDIKTYDKFYDFQRRILDVAEKDSEKSGDIKFLFTGKPEAGSKKIGELQYSIYRIGNTKEIAGSTDLTIAPSNLKEGQKKKGAEKDTTHKDKLLNLSESERRAYMYLAELGINKAFIVDNILVHPNFNYELLRGCEDEYLKILWQWFSKKTKSDVKAAAFVSWWKNGRLTREDVHWQIVEILRQRFKNKEKKAPTIFDSLQNTEPNPIKKVEKVKNIPIQINRPINKKGVFDFEKFKTEHPSVLERISSERLSAFDEFKEIPNYTLLLKNSIESHCEQWWRQLG